MAKKDSTAKKVGRFVANELLGVDDAKRAVKYARKGEFKKAAKSAVTGIAEAGSTVLPIGAGAKVGKVAGKALARSVAKEASPKVLKAANKAKGSGKMVHPKPASGKTTKTAPKRDVVVRTKDRTFPLDDNKIADKTGRFIDNAGRKSIKVNTDKPIVRTIEKEISKKQADKATAASNKLRYGSAKAETRRMETAVGSSKILPRGGKIIGATAGAGTTLSKATNKKKK